MLLLSQEFWKWKLAAVVWTNHIEHYIFKVNILIEFKDGKLQIFLFRERLYAFASNHSGYCMRMRLSHGIKQEYLQEIIVMHGVLWSRVVASNLHYSLFPFFNILLGIRWKQSYILKKYVPNRVWIINRFNRGWENGLLFLIDEMLLIWGILIMHITSLLSSNRKVGIHHIPGIPCLLRRTGRNLWLSGLG